ncbi:Sir2 family NAD-dependent protein deacetylase [Agarilytica rhodophyticola]|uniref:Sir2 family NAD-dependent protein deacetylase n=1 Tax=Agarilytica rhodophyticola TaxID=1737490 RepID=UPI000B341BE3|nr:Sir2 family NAD-dependent protein deacetylase [Agarilytica rhodophyticola]
MSNKPPINPNKVVVFSGAGISAESGLNTFRDANGLWENYPVELVATSKGWQQDPGLVLDFYNKLRQQSNHAQPNQAHYAIADLEKTFDVVVITQNIDDLHERAGSSVVIHLHGELNKARSSLDNDLIYNIEEKPIHLGQKCELNSQLRPHVVWFGETPLHMEKARKHFLDAAYVLVVGTSLVVEPAAGLLKKARYKAQKIIVTLDIDKIPYGYKLLRGRASSLVPAVCEQWRRG